MGKTSLTNEEEKRDNAHYKVPADLRKTLQVYAAQGLTWKAIKPQLKENEEHYSFYMSNKKLVTKYLNQLINKANAKTTNGGMGFVDDNKSVVSGITNTFSQLGVSDRAQFPQLFPNVIQSSAATPCSNSITEPLNGIRFAQLPSAANQRIEELCEGQSLEEEADYESTLSQIAQSKRYLSADLDEILASVALLNTENSIRAQEKLKQYIQFADRMFFGMMGVVKQCGEKTKKIEKLEARIVKLQMEKYTALNSANLASERSTMLEKKLYKYREKVEELENELKIKNSQTLKYKFVDEGIFSQSSDASQLPRDVEMQEPVSPSAYLKRSQ